MRFNKNHQLASLIFTLISVDYLEFATTSPSDCVTISNRLRFQKIYSRKKRYVVFPPGSAVVATPSVLKALSPVKPSGINLLLEFDFFYPLQTSVAEWYPKKKAESKIDMDGVDYESDPMSEPSTNQLPYPPDTNYQPPNSAPYSNYHSQYPAPNPNYQSPYPAPYPNIEQNQLWQQYAIHRNRRDIIGHIERVAADNGFDIKSCLLRVICEANHYLLPQGQSFFQDVLRILFTTTYKENVPDEYTNAMNISADDCYKLYESQCRFSILGFLLENTK